MFPVLLADCSIFVHWYRDSDPTICVECICKLSIWISKFPMIYWINGLKGDEKPKNIKNRFRLRMKFAVWTERMQTPKVQSDAIRALQQAMSETVTRYFAIDVDGSFDLDIAFIQASAMMKGS